MSRQMWGKVIQILALALIVLLFYQNQAPCDLTFVAFGVRASAGVALLIGYLLCLAASGAAAFLSASQGKQNEKRLEKWQNQDAKLLVEVQSDKEKQLEAKIATLEAALKRALKK